MASFMKLFYFHIHLFQLLGTVLNGQFHCLSVSFNKGPLSQFKVLFCVSVLIFSIHYVHKMAVKPVVKIIISSKPKHLQSGNVFSPLSAYGN